MKILEELKEREEKLRRYPEHFRLREAVEWVIEKIEEERRSGRFVLPDRLLETAEFVKEVVDCIIYDREEPATTRAGLSKILEDDELSYGGVKTYETDGVIVVITRQGVWVGKKDSPLKLLTERDVILFDDRRGFRFYRPSA